MTKKYIIKDSKGKILGIYRLKLAAENDLKKYISPKQKIFYEQPVRIYIEE